MNLDRIIKRARKQALKYTGELVLFQSKTESKQVLARKVKYFNYEHDSITASEIGARFNTEPVFFHVLSDDIKGFGKGDTVKSGDSELEIAQINQGSSHQSVVITIPKQERVEFD